MKRSVAHSILPNGKRGISDVVATVIIVALSIVAISVVWIGVMPLIRDKLGSSDVCNDVDVSIETAQGYTCWDSTANKLFVQIKKGAGDVNITGLKFYLSSEGNSVNFVRDTDLQKNSYKIFSLNTTGISNLEKLEVVPVSNTKDCSKVFIDKISNCSSEECFLDCSCAGNTIVGQTCSNGCGGWCDGIRPAPTEEELLIQQFTSSGGVYDSTKPLVVNTTHGHIWQASSSVSNINWYAAKLYCQNLKLCKDGNYSGSSAIAGDCAPNGGDLIVDWRLPSGDDDYTPDLDLSPYRGSLSYFKGDVNGFSSYDYYWLATDWDNSAYAYQLDLKWSPTVSTDKKTSNFWSRVRCVSNLE